MAFGVRRREFAVGIAGAGNQATAQIRLLPVQPHFHQRLFDGLDECVGNVRDDEVLPNGQADFAGAVVVRQISQTQHLFRRDVADRNRHADPVQPGLLLRIDADVGVRNGAVEWWSGGALIAFPRYSITCILHHSMLRHSQQFVTEQFLGLFQIFFHGPALEQMFQARLFPVAPIAVSDVNPDDRNKDFEQFPRTNEHAEIAREGFVARRAAQVEAEIDSGRNGVGDQFVRSQGRTD